jgi:hypothetical protein
MAKAELFTESVCLWSAWLSTCNAGELGELLSAHLHPQTSSGDLAKVAGLHGLVGLRICQHSFSNLGHRAGLDHYQTEIVVKYDYEDRILVEWDIGQFQRASPGNVQNERM